MKFYKVCACLETEKNNPDRFRKTKFYKEELPGHKNEIERKSVA
jgi:hypothetical protein